MWVAFAFTHIFQQNTCELDVVLTKTVNILTTNELVKLMMLWTTGPSFIALFRFMTHRGSHSINGMGTCSEEETTHSALFPSLPRKGFTPKETNLLLLDGADSFVFRREMLYREKNKQIYKLYHCTMAIVQW